MKSDSCWGNLEGHVTRKHPEYLQEMLDARDKRLWIPESCIIAHETQLSMTSFCPPGVEKVYGWLDWILSSLHPFSFVTDEKTRLYTSLPSIDVRTFIKYLHLLVRRVENKINQELVCAYV